MFWQAVFPGHKIITCQFIHAHGGGEGGGHLTYPLKSLQKLDHKNAIKHENRGPPSQIFSQPQVPPSKEFEMTVHLCYALSRCTFDNFVASTEHGLTTINIFSTGT